MMSFACGFRRARPRQEIIEALGLDDRYFRDICAETPEIITSEKFGYYILPLVDPTGEETRFALKEVNEGDMRRKIIGMYLRMRRQRNAIRRLQDKEKQLAFV
jgi:predicted translin family RNA/ssDNA-binding protein